MSKNSLHYSKTNTEQNYDKYEPVITTKEARKILGKKASDQLSDEAVGRLIGSMALIADRLLESRLVPQNEKVI